MSANDFDRLESEMASAGVEPTLQQLADQLLSQKKYRDLFTIRQMQVRHRLGLPIADAADMDKLQEPQRTQLEEGYVAACREVGTLFLADGAIRDAWTYLQISGDKQLVRQAMENISLGEDDYQRADEVVEIALYEGVWPLKGLELILNTHGTCNAITTLDGAMHNLSREDQQAAAGLMVRHLHEELLANVRADIEDRKGQTPDENATLAELLTTHDDLLADDNYHIDTSHLASIARFARSLEDADDLRLALDLTEYGQRLNPQYQFEGEPPFVEMYASHAIFFRAALASLAGKTDTDRVAIDEALSYFAERARAVDVEAEGSGAVEFYVALLSRVGRHEDAIDALAEMIPADVHTTGVAPTLLELAERAGNYEKLLRICRQRGDLIGFTMGMVEAKLLRASASS